MAEVVVTEQAVKAAAAKIAGPTVWAETWRRPHYENIARSALAAAVPKLDEQLELDDAAIPGLESAPTHARPDDGAFAQPVELAEVLQVLREWAVAGPMRFADAEKAVAEHFEASGGGADHAA